MSSGPTTDTPAAEAVASNFIRKMIDEDLASGKHTGIVTRFPPEPNGHLHIGHAKSICLNFGLARDYGGVCHLRFDDTNPLTEEVAFIEGIQDVIRWLGFDWGDHLYFASDYFEQLYDHAVALINKGLAYVDSQSAETIRAERGAWHDTGTDSPHRGRSVEENLDLFARMRAGEFEDGAHVLRARIDMASPNMNLRDPILYRIRHAHHPRTGDAWCIYPNYDFTHGLSDAIEGITHSICTLEFEDHRPLYEWVNENAEAACRPQQIEFARLGLGYTVMSKRRLLELVRGDLVDGWDDPRMPTLAAMRRRGVPPEAIRNLCERVGVSKRNSLVDISWLEEEIREVLNNDAPRAMAVIDPIEVLITNYPAGQSELLSVPNHPFRPELGSREVPFSERLWIERDDFRKEPEKKFFRLAPGREVRLRSAYFIRCEEVVEDADGNVIRLLCSYDPLTRGGAAPDGRKVKGTLHWVSADHAVDAEVRLYDRLFVTEIPGGEDRDWKEDLNPNALEVRQACKIEPALAESDPGTRFQFERLGYFSSDPVDTRPNAPVFNRIATLRDTWAKAANRR